VRSPLITAAPDGEPLKQPEDFWFIR